MKKMKKVTPQRLLQMIDPAAVLEVIEDAAAMFGDRPFAVIISDPRSMQGCVLIATTCEPLPDDEAAARERAGRLMSRVEGADREIRRTGAINIQYSCAPLDVLGPQLDAFELSEVRAGLHATDDGTRVVVFAVDEVAVASMRFLPVAIGVA
jgi:hypothetical protein